MAAEVRDQPRTVRDWLRFAVNRFNEAGLSFGHGSTNAHDEAAYLILHTLKLPLDRLDPFLDTDADCGRNRVGAKRAAPAHRRAHAGRLSDPRSLAGRFSFLCRRARDRAALVHRGVAARRVAVLGERRPDPVGEALDLCTGSGCLAILLALAFPDAEVDATEISPDALEVAARNVSDYGLQRSRCTSSAAICSQD